jgi:putative restriction endonuclease
LKLYVGITDRTWYEILSKSQPDEVNFWKPGAFGTFAALQPGELFLFKLHAPHNFIVGGAHFVKFSKLPVSLAWLAFGEKNGVSSLSEFQRRIVKYRQDVPGPDPTIGNIVLSQPFWFPQDRWIPAPHDWPLSTVQGKSYDVLEGRGYDLWAQVRERLGLPTDSPTSHEAGATYSVTETRVRLGQGAFRVVVTDAYERRCAITGESTLPVLEAAHVRPYAQDGPHAIENGLLLRSDMHILFDKGLITVTPELRVEVSGHIKDQYTNGKLYYSYQGEKLRSLPAQVRDYPNPDFLTWHLENVFVP